MPAPAILSDFGLANQRVGDLKQLLQGHFNDLRELRRYSRQRETAWLTGTSEKRESVMRSQIRASETTAIAFLTGNAPVIRVARNAATSGTGFDPASAAQNARFARIARAIWHSIDGQSPTPIQAEAAQQIIKQGELIIQYGWLNEADRTILSDADPQADGAALGAGGSGSAGTSLIEHGGAAYGEALPHGGSSDPLAQVAVRPEAVSQSPGEENPVPIYGAGLDSGVPADYSPVPKPPPAAEYRFPIFLRFLSRLKVVYELDPYGYPLEVYHGYGTTVSEARAEFPDWEQGAGRGEADKIAVIDAWYRGWHSVFIDNALVYGPALHGYGNTPPFVIERARPEDVSQFNDQDEEPEVIAGIPFALDMVPAFKEACESSSIKKTIAKHAAYNAKFLQDADARRYRRTKNADDRDQGGGATIQMGPGTIFIGYKGEKLVDQQPPQLPAVLEAYLEEAERDMAMLSFSPQLLRGEMPGDPSGYSIEQVKQATTARLQPYKVAEDRGLSRVMRACFQLLATHWAKEWGDTLMLRGQQKGVPFVEPVSMEDLQSPPEHVEVEVIPLTPQAAIAEHQDLGMMVEKGLMDHLVALEKRGSADPQEEWNSWLLHHAQMTVPEMNLAAVGGILNERAARAQGGKLPAADQAMSAPAGFQPSQIVRPQPPPGAQVIRAGSVAPQGGPPGAPASNVVPMQRPGGGPPGPAPQPRPSNQPLGRSGTPNNPNLQVVRGGKSQPRATHGGKPSPFPPKRPGRQ